MGKGTRIGLAAVMCVVLLCSAAQAALVTYTTGGSFAGGPVTQTPSITFGGGANELTITFNGLASTTVDADPTSFASLGEFLVETTGTGATITPGTTFDLQIDQTVPSMGQATLSGTMSGLIDQNSSTGAITLALTAANIGIVQYTALSNPIVLVPPSSNGGRTTVQAQVVIPEPATFGLLAAAGGLLALRRRGR